MQKTEFYDAPSTQVFEVKAEGVICASGETGATMDEVFVEEVI